MTVGPAVMVSVCVIQDGRVMTVHRKAKETTHSLLIVFLCQNAHRMVIVFGIKIRNKRSVYVRWDGREKIARVRYWVEFSLVRQVTVNAMRLWLIRVSLNGSMRVVQLQVTIPDLLTVFLTFIAKIEQRNTCDVQHHQTQQLPQFPSLSKFARRRLHHHAFNFGLHKVAQNNTPILARVLSLVIVLSLNFVQILKKKARIVILQLQSSVWKIGLKLVVLIQRSTKRMSAYSLYHVNICNRNIIIAKSKLQDGDYHFVVGFAKKCIF